MLTPRQAELLAYIDAETRRNGYCPSFLEMQAHLGISSKGNIHAMLAQLERRGFIRKLRYQSRAIEVIRRPQGSAPVTSILADMADHLEPELLKLRQDFTVPGGGLDPDMGDDLRDWIETGEALVERARSALGAAP